MDAKLICQTVGVAYHAILVVFILLLTDKRRIPLRSSSVRTPHLFHHGIPKVLVNPRSKEITSVQSTSMH
jgi:hypothetical protein